MNVREAVPSGKRDLGGAAAVACMAGAVLTLELAFTRIASAVLQFQFTFVVITLSLTGLGVGAILAARPRGGWSPALTAPAFALVTLAVIQALPFVVRIQGGRYWLTGLVLLPPFMVAGHFITVTFRTGERQAGVLYAADLAGAAGGCLLAGTAMNAIGPVPTARLAAVIGFASGLPYLRRLAPRGRRMALSGFGTALCALLFLPALGRSAATFSSRPSVSTQPFITEARVRDVVRTYWDAFARTDVVRDPDSPDRLEIYTNGNVPSTMYRVSTPLSAATGPDAARAALEAGGLPGAATLPFLMAPPGRVLSVGPGGGLDLLLAIATEAHHVDAVEMNPSIPRVLRDYAAFNGRIPDHPTIHFVVDDARHFVERTDQRYDLVFAALTQSGVGASPMVLPESHFSTREGFAAVWRRLAPGGRVALVFHNPAYAYRALATAAASLRVTAALSDAEVLARAMLFSGDDDPHRVLLILQREPVQAAAASQLARLAPRLGLRVVHLPPEGTGSLGLVLDGKITLARHLSALDRSVGVQSGVIATDDRPYFLDLDLKVPRALTAMLLAGLLALAGIAGRAPGHAAGRFRRRRLLIAAGCTGAGFMIFELLTLGALVRAFGDPTVGAAAGLFTVLVAGSFSSLLVNRHARSRGPARASCRLPGAAALACLVVGAGGGLRALFVGSPVAAAPLLALAGLIGVAATGGYASLLCWADRDEPPAIPWLWAANTTGTLIGGVAGVTAPRIVGIGWSWQLGGGCFALAAAFGAVMTSSTIPPSTSSPAPRAHRRMKVDREVWRCVSAPRSDRSSISPGSSSPSRVREASTHLRRSSGP